MPRQLFELAIQAAIGGKIVARESLQANRKDVTAGLYGGVSIVMMTEMASLSRRALRAKTQAAQQAESRKEEAEDAGGQHRGPASGLLQRVVLSSTKLFNIGTTVRFPPSLLRDDDGGVVVSKFRTLAIPSVFHDTHRFW